ncbi:MAG TPA: terpene cyclase/mutase family protein [Pirellulaceae bacterium]|nr:terpene cyclase/mutase family protein [Pirellulaceae bacterium]
MSSTKQKPETDPRQTNSSSAEQAQGDDANESIVGNRFLFFQAMPSWLTSFVIHVLLIVLLALLTFALPREEVVSLRTGEAIENTNTLNDMLDSFDMTDMLLENTEFDEVSETEFIEKFDEVEVADVFEDSFAVSDILSESLASSETATVGDLGAVAPHVGGRSASAKAKMLRERGGTAGSENAVALALEWLARHQLKDGSWNFDHRIGDGEGDRRSPHPGTGTPAKYGATAIALLPFLGAGHTHLEGEYAEVVRKGVEFLKTNKNRGKHGLSFSENAGTMYSHGLASLVLTELYAMTRDSSLSTDAQAVIDFIVASQAPVGGGWRYNFQQAGDTSVVGWQVMALKSADMGGLKVPSDTIRGVHRFLDSVSSGSGSMYGYTDPTNEGQIRPGMTAVGLLCQMYLGWTRDNGSLQAGIGHLNRIGPRIGDWKPDMQLSEQDKYGFRADMYYNYYATMVMSQYGGPEWKKWNEEMREFLIATQAQRGQSRGSWWFNNADDLGTRIGGRLYCTAMAAMTLEVYYRYLPLYDTKKTQASEFPLD